MSSNDISQNEETYILSSEDLRVLERIKPILSGIALAYGPNCMVCLYAAIKSEYPCIAVENGKIDHLAVGAPAPKFIRDIMSDEAHRGGKDVVGIYYMKTEEDHAMKCVANLIRNENQDLIGCLFIGIDLSVPLHEFVRNFIPVVDNDLANSISEPLSSRANNVDTIVKNQIKQAIAGAARYSAISATERNKLIVKDLQDYGIFNIRNAVSIVAKELGVTRYTVYNYLKDIADPI